MKILMVTMAMENGGAETHVMELCRELAVRNHDITLVSAGGVYADQLRDYGVRLIKLPLDQRRPSPVMTSYRGLKGILKNERFDIIHAHARIPAFICSSLADRLTDERGVKPRFVTTAHLDFSVNPVWRMLSRWGERTMAVSEDIADYLVREYGLPRSRIHLTVNGIDTAKFSPDTDCSGLFEKHGLRRENRRIVYMSRLDADRADPAFRLLEIAKEIDRRYPDTEIIIVGGGSELEKIRSKAADINKETGKNLVTVTGAVSNTYEYCAAADIFIGVSRSALEAMASAKPAIIAGNQGSIGIFTDEKIPDAQATNFCCRGYPRADGEGLLRNISELLDMDHADLERMGSNNRKFVLENYTASRMADDYLEMYEAALRSPVQFSRRKGRSDVLISGYYGYGNLGDESLLDIISRSVAELVPGVRISALARAPKKASRASGVGCIERFNLIAASRIIRNSRVLISGGGSLLQDTTSKRNLIYYAGVMRMAERAGTGVCVYANGVGPINYESNKKLTKRVIEGADYVSVRDRGSVEELRKLGVDTDAKIRLTADPAFLIRPSGEEAVNRIKNKLGLAENYIAVSLRPVAVSNKGRNKARLTEQDTKLAVAVAETCAEMYRKRGYVTLIIPMQKAQDMLISERLKKETEIRGGKAVIYMPELAGDLISILHGSELTIGMRLHSIIFASSAEVPVIGISYDPKIDSMMKELGQEYIISAAGNRETASKLAEYSDEVIRDRERISAYLAERADAMRNLAAKDADAVADLLGDGLHS